MAVLLISCANKPEPVVEATPEPTRAALPKGSDYLSTVIRAKGRAVESLSNSDRIRRDQKQEELDFDRKVPAGK